MPTLSFYLIYFFFFVNSFFFYEGKIFQNWSELKDPHSVLTKGEKPRQVKCFQRNDDQNIWQQQKPNIFLQNVMQFFFNYQTFDKIFFEHDSSNSLSQN